MLLGLVMDYCEAINSDAVPSIDNSVTRLVQEEIDVIEQEAFDGLKISLDNELGLEVTSEEIFEEVVSRAQRSAVRTLQTNLARFLTFKEILEVTKRFKQRIASSGIVETHKALCYHQSFMFSLEVFQQSCEAASELMKKTDVEKEDLANVQDLSQEANIGELTGSYQQLIRDYLDSVESEGALTQATYDILAENLCKLGVKTDLSAGEAAKASQFVDYEALDLVQEDEDDIQVSLAEEDNDTMQGQSRKTAQELLQPKVHQASVLDSLESHYEQNITKDVYETSAHLLKI